MKILWFTGRVRSKNTSYGGGGWIRSLAKDLACVEGVTLAMAYFFDREIQPFVENGIEKYPMFLEPKSRLRKFFDNWRNNPEYTDEYLLNRMMSVIEKYKPDVIQIFGTESLFTSLIGQTNIPVVLYLQGLINPIYNAYYPYKMNRHTLRFWRFDSREWLFNNGRIYRERQLLSIAKNERKIFKKTKYIIGRTQFDYRISRLFAPTSKYFKVNEMMRETFYQGKVWERPQGNIYNIFSTLSGVTYKGFDVILKTAELLKENNVNFKWRIAGLNKNSDIVSLFERHTHILSDSVNVEYLGILGEEALKEHLLKSNVMVHPSYIDNSPNSVCEAQLLGLPVIATYVGGIPDFIVPGKTGELVPNNDPYDLAFYLIKDISTPYLQMYSEPAYSIAKERHSKKSIVNDLMSAYNEVLYS